MTLFSAVGGGYGDVRGQRPLSGRPAAQPILWHHVIAAPGSAEYRKLLRVFGIVTASQLIPPAASQREHLVQAA
jgi:hypothetical protein